MPDQDSFSAALSASRADIPDAVAEFSSAAGFRRLRAAFRDPELERAYQKHLTLNALPRERRIWLLMSLVYFLYGALDILTIGEQREAVLAVRWLLLTPIALGIYALTFIDRFKPHAGSLFSFGVFLSATSIVWMIYVLPPQGSPPYIIGILVVFIFSSCNVQMPFPAAATAFAVTTISYSFILLANDKFTRIDVISGHFFMISSAGVAVLTNYVQEIRLRMIWINGERRRADAAKIQNLMIEATASDQSKINFLSILSHELRTPLHQIIGFSEVLRAPGGCAEPEKSTEYLTEIHSSAHRLLASIAKMLRYADATAGKISYDLDRHLVADIVEMSVDQFASRAAQRDIVIEVGPVADGLILIDQASTSYAIGCLIDNAINASPARSRIVISGARVEGDCYELRIADSGVGMSEAQIRQAFEPFSQVGHFRTRTIEGIGLGLTLARKILGDQGATLKLQSAPGSGTTARILFASTDNAVAAA